MASHSYDDSTLQALVDYLSDFTTPQRRQRMEEVLAWRTRYLVPVLEDIYQPHNASAVLRSCEAFGLQELQIIENRNSYRVNPDVELGTSSWLDLRRFRASAHGRASAADAAAANTEACLLELKQRGYRLVATVPRPDAVPLSDFDVGAGKIALLFGTELSGLSQTALELADEAVSIPMFGFVESLNISVCAALCFFDLTRRIRQDVLGWQLDTRQKNEVLLGWLRKSLKRSKLLEESFRARC